MEATNPRGRFWKFLTTVGAPTMAVKAHHLCLLHLLFLLLAEAVTSVGGAADKAGARVRDDEAI